MSKRLYTLYVPPGQHSNPPLAAPWWLCFQLLARKGKVRLEIKSCTFSSWKKKRCCSRRLWQCNKCRMTGLSCSWNGDTPSLLFMSPWKWLNNKTRMPQSFLFQTCHRGWCPIYPPWKKEIKKVAEARSVMGVAQWENHCSFPPETHEKCIFGVIW